MTTILPDQDDMGLGWMHVYGQQRPHAPAIIVANRKALEQLQQAIGAALASLEGEAEVFASDGEGYRVQVRMVNVLNNLGEPRYISYLER